MLNGIGSFFVLIFLNFGLADQGFGLPSSCHYRSDQLPQQWCAEVTFVRLVEEPIDNDPLYRALSGRDKKSCLWNATIVSVNKVKTQPDFDELFTYQVRVYDPLCMKIKAKDKMRGLLYGSSCEKGFGTFKYLDRYTSKLKFKDCDCDFIKLGRFSELDNGELKCIE